MGIRSSWLGIIAAMLALAGSRAAACDACIAAARAEEESMAHVGDAADEIYSLIGEEESAPPAVLQDEATPDAAEIATAPEGALAGFDQIELLDTPPMDEMPPGADPFDMPVGAMPFIHVPAMKPGWRFQAGLLYLQPSADNLGWGILTTEHNYASPYPLATPLWNVETLQPGYQPGFEVGGGYTFFGTSQDVQLNWQHLRTNTYDSGAAGDGQWISPFSQTGPPTADTYQELNSNSGVNLLQTANAQVKFSYDAVNLDFGQYVGVGEQLMFRLFAGLSYAQLREQLYSTFYGAQPSPTAPFPENTQISIALNNTTSFWGVGPRFGFDSSYLTKRGLRLTGQLAGAMLIGQTQPAQYEFAGSSPELALVGITSNREYVASNAFTHVVWATNAKLGIGYSRVLPGGSVFTVDAGYLAAIYVSALSGYETNENILALQIGSLSSGSIRHIPLSDLTLHGFYFNAGLNW